MENDNKKANNLLKIFYTFIIVAIILAGLYYWNERQSFYLMENNVKIPLNSNYTISLIGRMGDYDDFVYESSNEEVATVDDGVVHANGSGNAEISIKSKYGINKEVLAIEVGEDDIYLLEFENDNIILKEKDNYTLKPLINGESNYKTDLIYTSSDDKVISVNNNGNCIAKSVGIAYIEVKIKETNYSSKVKITVNKKETKKQAANNTKPSKTEEKVSDEFSYAPEEIVNTHIYVSDVKLSSIKSKIKVGESLQLTYNVIPSNATNKKVSFSSSNSDIASVSNTGVVKGLKAGSTSITIKTEENKKTAFIDIDVIEDTIKVKSISINKKSTSLVEGDKEKLFVNFNPNNATNQNVVWNSSNNNVATVDKNGNVVAKSVGTAIINAKSVDGNKEATCTVTVLEKSIPVKSIKVNKTSVTLNPKETVTLTASVEPNNATNQSLEWSSENTKVVTVTPEGLVRAVGTGSTKIIVKTIDGSVKQEINVKVNEVLITSITLNGDNMLIKGTSNQICLTYNPGNATDKLIAWSSSDNNIISVDKEGNIKGVNLGVATITATNKKSGKKASIKITVVPNQKLIDIRNATYKKFITLQAMYDSSRYQHTQNFAISKLGKSDQIIYLSGTDVGCYSKEKYPTLTAEQKSNLVRTIIYEVKKADINDPSKRRKMFLEDAGHGQAFDIEPDSNNLWVNYYGIKPDAPDSTHWWGKHGGIMKIKFAELGKGKSYKPEVSHKITYYNSSTGNTTDYINMAPSIDVENDLILLYAGKYVIIYKFSDFKKGIKTVVYKFNLNPALPSSENGVSLANQGGVLRNGYFYQIKGFANSNNYIEVFDLTGQSVYHAKVGKASDSTEPEGIKIYNNKIYFGLAYSNSNKKPAFDIAYMDNSKITITGYSIRNCNVTYATN